MFCDSYRGRDCFALGQLVFSVSLILIFTDFTGCFVGCGFPCMNLGLFTTVVQFDQCLYGWLVGFVLLLLNLIFLCILQVSSVSCLVYLHVLVDNGC